MEGGTYSVGGRTVTTVGVDGIKDSGSSGVMEEKRGFQCKKT